MADRREVTGLDRMSAVESFRLQARGCAVAGSPLYAELLARAHAPAIRARLGSNVQTNEVLRCTALLGGFLCVAAEMGLPCACVSSGRARV